MEKFLKMVEQLLPLLTFYPRWTQVIFVLSFVLVLVSIFLFIILYPSASNKKRETSISKEEISSKQQDEGRSYSDTDMKRGQDDRSIRDIVVKDSPHTDITVIYNYPHPPNKESLRTEPASSLSLQFESVRSDVEKFFELGESAYKNGDFPEALLFYQKAVEKIKLPAIYLAISNTHLMLRNYDGVIKYTGKVFNELENAPEDQRIKLRAQAFDLRGISFLETKKLSEAEGVLKQSLELWRQLSKDNEERDIADMAGTLNNLGILAQRRGFFSEGHSYLKDALNIFDKLSKKSPKKYKNNVAMSLFNLGALEDEWHQSERLQNAIGHFEKALTIYRELSNNDPKAYKPLVALTVNRLARLFADDAQLKAFASVPLKAIGFPIHISYEEIFEKAENYYKEALSIFEELANNNPSLYEPDLSSVLNDFGIFSMDIKRYDEAATHFQRAMSIRKKLAQQDPNRFFNNLAGTITNLGKLATITDKDVDAESYYNEAKEIYEKIDPNCQGMAIVLNNLGRLRLKIGDNEEAETLLLNSFSLSLKLMKNQPWKHRPFLAIQADNLVMLYRKIGNIEKANKYEKISQDIRKGKNMVLD